MKASKHYEADKQGKPIEVKGNPAYDLLVPLTIPFDIIAAPVRGVIWIKEAQHQGDGS
jgi:hypothetical protein